MAKRPTRPRAPRGFKLVKIQPKRRKKRAASGFFSERAKAKRRKAVIAGAKKAGAATAKFTREKAAPFVKKEAIAAGKATAKFTREKAVPFLSAKFKSIKQKIRDAKQRREFKKRGITVTKTAPTAVQKEAREESQSKGVVEISRPRKVFI